MRVTALLGKPVYKAPYIPRLPDLELRAQCGRITETNGGSSDRRNHPDQGVDPETRRTAQIHRPSHG